MIYKIYFYKYVGKCQVMYLDFKSLSGSSYRKFINNFKTMVRKTFKSHTFLLKNRQLDEEEKYRFKDFYYKRQISKLLDDELGECIQTLSELLYIPYNKKSVVIDEYNGSVSTAINKL